MVFNLFLIHKYLCLTWKRAIFILLHRALLLELLQHGERWWGCWNVRLSQLTLGAISHRWQLMALASCQGAKPSSGKQWPGSFEVVAAPEHSFAVTNCSTCCDVPLLAPDVPPKPTVSLLGSPSPLILLTTSRSSSFIGQWWCQGSTRSFHLLNYPLLQDSSPHLLVGALLQVGF